MYKLMHLTRRNLVIFLKDKRRMFFTFIAPLIVLLCFVLFARRIYFSQMPENFPEQIKNQYADISMLIGLLSTTLFTNAVSLSSIMIADAERKVLNDLYIAPVHPGIVRFSYLIYNIFLNISITLFMFIIGICWMAINKTIVVNVNFGNVDKTYYAFDTSKIFTIIGIIFLGGILNSSIFVFLLSFLNNTSAFSAISASLSAVAGFLIGAFVPLHTFPRPIAEFSSLIPSTHISNMVRHFIIQDLVFSDTSIFTEKHAAYDYNVLFGQNIKWWGSLIYTMSWTALMVTLNISLSNLKRK
ncbi:ABC transporter permease [Mycoplasma tauri]|uniref:ABC transporter permease n=1 Tax=Mycoplasma tauri TaxID=547987 RepID=A0A953NC52_9MOLU|nr:ABC transporter permease [Mycoplasma tauri]MBZ4195147.1 ABC transporter permease [Mycoplasma tauri]MBZ4204505.1 ABC transporter permease [Mycoplasma tauri]MBZ4212422.1 ABC transporter permease [Mycoplasma tauri]MBZ4218150.1 ABC transporter permease [Mycoplasma tauri]